MTDDDESKVFSLRQRKEGKNERRDKGMNIFERFTTRSILNTWGKTLREQCSKRISCAVSMRENSRGLEEETERPPMNVFLSVCVFSPRGYMNGFLVSSYNCSINTRREIEEEREEVTRKLTKLLCLDNERLPFKSLRVCCLSNLTSLVERQTFERTTLELFQLPFRTELSFSFCIPSFSRQ